MFITYHSLEDRLVKRFIADGQFEGEVEKDVYGTYRKRLFGADPKPLEPSAEELNEIPRARSARPGSQHELIKMAENKQKKCRSRG